MILFELYRQLDVRMYMTVAALDRNFGACSKYLITGNSLILLGTEHSVKLDLTNKTMTVEKAIKEWDIDSEAVLWFAEDSAEACIIRLINNAFREWLKIDPFSSTEEFEAATAKLNAILDRYNLRVVFDSNSLKVLQFGEVITFEEALEIIIEIDSDTETELMIAECFAEAEYQRSIGQLEEAAKNYEHILKHIERSVQLYTICSFKLAEIYYFLNNNERSALLYYRCNPAFITDERDFYIHLGHALLDSKMKKYERQIRIYYRGMLDPLYAQNHVQAIRAASRDVSDVFKEYEETCFEMGEKKYREHYENLPPQADDIDELVLEEALYENDSISDDYIKVYEKIHLLEHAFLSDNGSSKEELISDGLDSYNDGEYQKSFEAYLRLKSMIKSDSEQYTWTMLQLGKLYCIFDEYKKAKECLSGCALDRFNDVYKKDDYLLLYEHVKTVCNHLENDIRYRSLIRGIIDPYYAKTDRTYYVLSQEKNLTEEFAKYEKECREKAVTDCKSDQSEKILEKKNKEDGEKLGFFGRIKKFFRK